MAVTNPAPGANGDIRVHGKNGAIYIGGGRTTGGTKIAAKTEWTLNLNRDYVDVTSFGDKNKRYLVGLKDVSGTYAGHFDSSGDDTVWATSEDSIPIYLYGDDRAASELLIAYGPGLMDCAITASVSDSIKITGNFRAAGDWTVFSGIVLTP